MTRRSIPPLEHKRIAEEAPKTKRGRTLKAYWNFVHKLAAAYQVSPRTARFWIAHWSPRTKVKWKARGWRYF